MEIMEFRPKPNVLKNVAAVQFAIAEGQTLDEAMEAALDILGGAGRIETLEDGTKILAFRYALDYFVDIDLGDYIILTPNGFNSMSEANFKKVYEPLDAPKRVRRTKAQIAADKAAKEGSK